MSSVIAVHSRTERTRDDWETPDWLIGTVRLLGRISLDPCTSPDNPVGAVVFFAPPDDGLALDWDGYRFGGLVWVNPPYGRALEDWARKVVAEAERRANIALLTPARPGNRWFELLWSRARAVCFLRGRLTFKGAPGPAPFPSMLWWFGEHPRVFEAAFRDAGIVEVLR